MIAARMKYAAIVAVSATILALVYATAGVELIDIALASEGPFGSSVSMMETLVPIIIALMYLFAVAIVVVGPVQEERARSRRRPRR